MLLLLLASFALPNPHPQQNLKFLLANAHGTGTLTVGDEVYKVTNVVVKLDEDGTGEITLVTDLQLFVQCTWSAPADLSQGIDLKNYWRKKRWQRRRIRETSAATGWERDCEPVYGSERERQEEENPAYVCRRLAVSKFDLS